MFKCHTYHTSGNYDRFVDLHNHFPNIYVRPTSSAGGYVHDSRYMCGLSLDPARDNINVPNFSTSCNGDSGGAVVYEDRHRRMWLIGIHHSGPSTCGNPSREHLYYDTAVYMSAVRRHCFGWRKTIINVTVVDKSFDGEDYSRFDTKSNQKC